MRVKVKVHNGDRVYDSETLPIMIVLSEADKKNIANMDPGTTKYCSFPDGCDTHVIKEWMKA